MQKTGFQWMFLRPKYWPTWTIIGFIGVIVTCLPHRLSMLLGKCLGHFSQKFLKRRVLVAKKNLALAFPESSQTYRQALLEENFKNLGCALFETGMAWFWPNWRLKKKWIISGQHFLEKAIADKQGVLIVVCHTLHLELAVRYFTLLHHATGVYRPNTNPFYEWLLQVTRCRGQNKLLDRKNIRGMLQVLKEKRVLWFFPDHDYGAHASVFVPFFGVRKAATITTPARLAKLKNVTVLSYHLARTAEGKYHIHIQPIANNFPSGNDEKDTANLNLTLQTQIEKAPAQYMWLHRRYKTTLDQVDHYQ